MRIFLISLVLLLSVCETIPEKDPLPAFHAAKPRSILVIPVVNRSVDVEAPLSVLTTLPQLLAEKGYYVFPINTVKTVLEREGLYEADEVHSAVSSDLAQLFGADCILYVTIHEWTTTYVFVHAETIVDLEYRIVSADGMDLWSARKRIVDAPEKSPRSDSRTTDFLSDALGALFQKLDPQFMTLTRRANREVFSQTDNALPPGPYALNYEDYYLALPSGE